MNSYWSGGLRKVLLFGSVSLLLLFMFSLRNLWDTYDKIWEKNTAAHCTCIMYIQLYLPCKHHSFQETGENYENKASKSLHMKSIWILMYICA